MHGLMMDAPLLVTEIMRFAERNSRRVVFECWHLLFHRV